MTTSLPTSGGLQILQDLVWTVDGMYGLVLSYLPLATVEIAPEAIFTGAYPVDDTSRLHHDFAVFLGDGYVPKPIPAPDFGECMFLGELVLYIQHLRTAHSTA